MSGFRLPVATLVLLAGCSVAATETGEPPIGMITVVRTDADIVLPLDSLVHTGQQQREVAKAVDVIGRQCMRRLGLDWASTPTTEDSDGIPNARRYTVLDPAKVSVEGYHPVELIKVERAATARHAARPALSQATVNAWQGKVNTYDGRPVPAGGCVGEAIRRLSAGIGNVDSSLPQRLQWESFGRMRTDSRVAKVFADWSSCMAAKGFQYRDPIAAFDDQRWQVEQITEQEIVTAVADVACKSETGVGGVMLAVETTYQRRSMREHATELTAVTEYLGKELESARWLVRDGLCRSLAHPC